MSAIQISASNISKYYRLGQLGSSSLKEDLVNWWRGKPKPEKILETGGSYSSHDLWALRDVSFDVAEGEVMGFVGANGAGKSTLLKIISRITLPTTGIIRGKGRIASLLEVGTGFHGELTGRENIYLNGHILGMKKKEIDRKFDEIVDFSGIESFLDTPVKRYSSGMYVRLAFGVAAHLDPEILIIDEVLAVGDSEFQKKCIAKMREVSAQKGKTILFVSHNLQALRHLCHRAILLEKGRLTQIGPAETVIASYLHNTHAYALEADFAPSGTLPGADGLSVCGVSLRPEWLPGQSLIDVRTPLDITARLALLPLEPAGLTALVQVFTTAGDCVFELSSPRVTVGSGEVSLHCRIPGHFLNDGAYSLSLKFLRNGTVRWFQLDGVLSFDVADFREAGEWMGKWEGAVRPDFPVNLGGTALL